MKRTFSILLTVFLIASMAMGAVACAPAAEKKAAESTAEKAAGTSAAETADTAETTAAEDVGKAEAAADAKRPGVLPEGEKNRVALILEGAISDMSWNATAYEGLRKIEAMGAETKYVENIPASAVADSIRTFAEAGYNVIFLATNSYQDNASKAAEEYPDIQFFMINSGVTAPNVRSFAIQDAEQGFLMGALSALLSKSKKVAFIGGLEINPIINGGKGFAQGVRYVDESVEVLSQNTNSFDDVNAAKDLAKAFIGRGADVLSPMANQASLGVMEAAEEEHAKAIGSGLNQETVAPDAAIVAVIKDTSIAYQAAYQMFLDGNMPEEILPMGAAQGVVYVGDYYQDVDQEIKDKLGEIQKKLASGEIKIDLQ